MPITKNDREKEMKKKGLERKKNKWQEDFYNLAQKHQLENETYIRNRKPQEDMKKLEQLELKIQKYKEASDP